jgi:hypothetical protein
MDELFEIKLAFRAHGIMVQRMEEVDHHGSRYAGEKSEVEERVESVWGISHTRWSTNYQEVRSSTKTQERIFQDGDDNTIRLLWEKHIICVQESSHDYMITTLASTSRPTKPQIQHKQLHPARSSSPLSMWRSHAFQGKGPFP